VHPARRRRVSFGEGRGGRKDELEKGNVERVPEGAARDTAGRRGLFEVCEEGLEISKDEEVEEGTKRSRKRTILLRIGVLNLKRGEEVSDRFLVSLAEKEAGRERRKERKGVKGEGKGRTDKFIFATARLYRARTYPGSRSSAAW
jgi:hypothetical protein